MKKNKYEKYKILGLVLKASFGTLGTSLILEQNHPYLTIIILSIGAGVNELLSYYKDKEYKNTHTKDENTSI